MFLAAFSPVPYFAFYLADRLHVGQQALAGTLALLTLANYGVGAVTSALGGWLSDRTGRRTPFVVAAMLVLATGMVLLAAADRLAVVLAAQLVPGLASGLYFSVDLALATQVLPSEATDAKDLGVMNVATVLPQSIGPAAAPFLIALGAGHNYTALYIAAAASAIGGAVAVTRLRGVLRPRTGPARARAASHSSARAAGRATPTSARCSHAAMRRERGQRRS